MYRGKRKKHLIVTFLALPACMSLFAVQPMLADGQRTGAKKLEFSERVVAGGPEDFMTVRHIKLRGSQREIGKKLAEIARTRHGLKPVKHDSLTTNERQAFYKKDYVLHYQRSLGVRDAFGIKEETDLDMTLLPYNMPAQYACSVAYYPPSHTASGHGTLSRNYDWTTGTWMDLLGPEAKNTKKTTEDPYVIEVYPDEGHASLYLCAYELLGGGLDGINSEGLTIALLANATEEHARPTNAWRPGLGEVEIVRYVLENCATVEEAKKALNEITIYYMLLPCHYIIGDRDGNSFVWEYSADLSQRYTVTGHGKPQWVTNHPVHLFPTADSIPASMKDSTFRRFRRLDEEIARATNKRSINEIKYANKCVSGLAKTDANGRTLWHSLYDCTNNSLEIDFYLGENGADGGQERSGYVRFQLEKR